MAEAEQQATALPVGQPVPGDPAVAAFRVAQDDAVIRPPADFQHMAVAADEAGLAVYRRVGLGVEPHLVADRQRQVILHLRLVAAAADRLVHALVVTDFTPRLQPRPDDAADVGRILVGQRRDGDRVAGSRRQQQVAPLHVEVGDAFDHLVLVAADQPRRAVIALHGQGFGGLTVTEQSGDCPAAPGLLAHGRQQFRQRTLRQHAPENLDRVAGLDRLALLLIA